MVFTQSVGARSIFNICSTEFKSEKFHVEWKQKMVTPILSLYLHCK